MPPRGEFLAGGVFRQVEDNTDGPHYRWYIPGDIDREVIQADIQRYLGPDAVSCPARRRDVRNLLPVSRLQTSLTVAGLFRVSDSRASKLYNRKSPRDQRLDCASG